jgi:rhodanese-related sulfurtransferase
MALFDALKKALRLNGTEKRVAQQSGTGARSQPEPEEEPRVPEVTAHELMAEMREEQDAARLLLDCREHYERAQSYIPDSLHIPMNSIPTRLAELDRDTEIVVYCAHGNRSYGVAGWLNQQGYTARSLKGGIVDWQHRGGAIESAYRNRA